MPTLQEIVVERRRAFSRKLCQHPAASRQACDQIVKAHTLRKEGSLRVIARADGGLHAAGLPLRDPRCESLFAGGAAAGGGVTSGVFLLEQSKDVAEIDLVLDELEEVVDDPGLARGIALLVGWMSPLAPGRMRVRARSRPRVHYLTLEALSLR